MPDERNLYARFNRPDIATKYLGIYIKAAAANSST